MNYSSDTGEAILSHYEAVQASVAEDGVLAIKSIMDELNVILATVQRLKDSGTLKASQNALEDFQNGLDDCAADLLSSDWRRLVSESYSIEYPERIPGLFGIRSSHISSNPNSYSMQRDEL